MAEGTVAAAPVLVFPSQVAADAWAVESLRSSGRAAVDPDRFIGWDRFKEAILPGHRSEAPANRVSRMLWAAGIVARQRNKRFLRGILGPGEPSTAFVGFLAKLPPSLEALAGAIRARSGDRRLLADEAVADLLVLRDDYAAFLAGNGLFEPSWAGKGAARSIGNFVIITPELIEDFEEYRQVLEGLPGVSFAGLPATGLAATRLAAEDLAAARPAMAEPGEAAGGETRKPRLTRFENLHEELRHVFLRIGALLDEGIAPHEIGVTVSDLDAARPWVEAAARNAGVPLVVRRGRPLAASPFGRLLREIGEAAATDFSLPSMQALLLDRFASWKEAAIVEGLVRFGVDKRAFASYASGGRKVDIWEESFRLCSPGPALPSLYRRLRSAILKATTATDFRALRSGITTFRAQFLDESGWSEAERRMVERAMEELGSLCRAEEALSAQGALPSPWALFLASLETEGYVPQAPGGLVQVFPWRVSALLPFTFHFIVGCGQDALRVVHGGESFLREDQREALGRVSRDATDDFLCAYALSGETVIACHADEGLAGWSVPHPFFPAGETEDEPRLAEDPYRLEARAFRGEAPPPARLLRGQKEALERFALIDRRIDREFANLAEPVLGRALSLQRRADGLLRLSSTLVDEYRACGFRALARRVLGIGEVEGERGFFDARLAGEMAHSAIRRCFAGIAALGPIAAVRLDDYRRLAWEAPAAILPEFAKKEGPFLVPMFEAWAPLLRDRLRRLVEDLAEDEGWEIGELEHGLERSLPELGAVLEGRIDRLARRGEERAIVDYKKKNLPAKAALIVEGGAEADGAEAATTATGSAAGSPSGEAGTAGTKTPVPDDEAGAVGPEEAGGSAPHGELANSQLASYASLVATTGASLVRASYWSLEDAKELVVVGEGGWRTPQAYGKELVAFESALFATGRGMLAGRFGYAKPNSLACRACTAKQLCRSHFTTR